MVAAGCETGLAFHVGSQCGSPEAYRLGIMRVGEVIRAVGFVPALINVGGGFPARYANTAVPQLATYMNAIRESLAALNLPPGVEFACEPGRALVADACSLLVQVLLRKEDRLYLNDGIYGSLSEMFLSKLRMPVRLIQNRRRAKGSLVAFSLYGPTCDSLDVVPGTFDLPADVEEGDWLEIGLVGAYSNAMASRFNGFYPETMVEVSGLGD